MVLSVFRKVLGDYNEKELRKLWPTVVETNDREEEIAALTDEALAAKTPEFRTRLAEGETLDNILPEAFAVVREASGRRLGMRHFDVQILGGIVLYQGKISEMKTGEGKTLVATLPLYLNGLAGKGAHLITVNDYLARRDAQWMGPIYHSLGLSIGVLQHDTAYIYDPAANLDNASLRHMSPVPRRAAYDADITYGTNNEFGFDYLRDNMVTDLDNAVQRRDSPHEYAIVDEVDSILIDEARTPLIISGPAEETEEVYRTFARIVPRLAPEVDYVVDHKHRSVSLSDEGGTKVEKALGIKNIYDAQSFRLTRFLDAALKAQALYHRDQQYVVKDGEVIIVDEFTGRLMPGRRWSDGLHQAVEAKEGVKVQRESVTYATITLQNYFRLYDKLAGMTGTAWTEHEEFHQIYGLDVIVIPTHQPMVRSDDSDIIYRNLAGKFTAVVEEIEDQHARGRPVLVGTVSIEISERLADMLKRLSQCHLEECANYHAVCPLKEPEVLNAKQHEREAVIVAQAGSFGAVTIATNMAGRGTDIILGGNPERLAEGIARKRRIDLASAPQDVAAEIRQEARDSWQLEHEKVVGAGGLHILGTERHEARRIDNQLRGRAGRQGDPGSSRFFVSFDDDVMKRFSPEWVPNLLGRMGMDEHTPLESGMVSKAIEQAQTKVEGHNFDIRKHVVQYDDVMNAHRDYVYRDRRKIEEGVDVRSNIMEMIDGEIERVFDAFVQGYNTSEWDLTSLITELKAIVPLPPHFTEEHFREMQPAEALEEVTQFAHQAYEHKEQELGEEKSRTLERLVLLGTIDRLWVYHLTALDEMRQGIGLTGYGGRDPLVEFKREAYDMFEQLKDHIRDNVTKRIFHVTLVPPAPPRPQPRQMQERGPDETANAAAGAPTATATATATAPAPSASRKVGRNDPCPCGSGKKYKKCHGSGGLV
ncbi:MAG: preprotein translocase subunit SecA [Dehalococcoidia bacterium]|nr:preprotein translocase subunit SecA [Dehalococcoidia bacterium]